MAIAYKSAGAGAGTETSGAQLSLAFLGGTVDANDILIAHVMYLTSLTIGPSTPSGWTLLDGPRNIGQATAVGRTWVFGKIADGTEDTANINFGTDGGTNGRAGRAYSFSGWESGTIQGVVPAARFVHLEEEDSTVNMPTVTVEVAGGMAVCLTAIDDNNAQASATGESGGNWAEAVAEYTDTALGVQGLSMGIQTAAMASGGTISGGSFSQGSTDEAGVTGFAILPNELLLNTNFSFRKLTRQAMHRGSSW